jgi:hypothetical protein
MAVTTAGASNTKTKLLDAALMVIRTKGYSATTVDDICEVGLAMAVLVGTGLLARTMMALLRTDIGFDSANLVTATVTLPSASTF